MDKKIDERERVMVEKIDKLDKRVFENEKDRINPNCLNTHQDAIEV
jgi:hypothetical protein